MNNNVKRPRKPSFKDEAIDVDDLANMSNMGGMLSFLDTKPEDYARLFAKAAGAEPLGIINPHESPTQERTTQGDPIGSATTPVVTTQGDISEGYGLDNNSAGSAKSQRDPIIIETTTRATTTHAEPNQGQTTQQTTTQVETTQVKDVQSEPARPGDIDQLGITQLLQQPLKPSPRESPFRKSGEILSQISKELSFVSTDRPSPTEATPTQPPTTQGTTTQPSPTQVVSTEAASTEVTPANTGTSNAAHFEPIRTKEEVFQPAVSGLSPTVSLGRGRIHQLKVREAKIVQDGHTASEQMVYDFLWRTGTPINANLRSIRIGRWGIANAVHVSDTTAKAAIKGLIEKLAIDRIGGSDSVLGFEYHVHSWGSCLTRRKERGLTHVIKSKGVVFVNPESGEALTGYFFPGSKSSPTQETTTQAGSSWDREVTRVVDTRGRGVERDGTTQVVNGAPPYNQLQNQNTITTTLVREELEHHTPVDEAGIKSLIHSVQNNAIDATWPELQYFIQEKAKVFKRVKVDNKFGFLLVAVPRCFENPAFETWRRAVAAEAQEQKRQEEHSRQFLELQHLRAVLIDPTASDDEKQAAQEVLDILER